MAILTTVQEAFTDQHIDAQEWVQVALGALMAFNVWATANLPGYDKMKTYVAVAIAVVTALYTFVIGGVDTAEVVNMIVIAFMALGLPIIKQPITTVVNGVTTASSIKA